VGYPSRDEEKEVLAACGRGAIDVRHITTPEVIRHAPDIADCT